MNTKDENRDVIGEILKNAHEEIKPIDSWEALRARIKGRIDNNKLHSVSPAQRIVFWRRLAFGMVACFLITAGILVYLLGAHYGVREYQRTQLVASNNLLNEVDLNRLSFAFSQVRQLFGQQSQWIMIGSGNSTQMSVGGETTSEAEERKLLAVRLAVNLDSDLLPQQYFDVVMFSNQQASFQLLLANISAIDIFLKPILRNDEIIEVEIIARSGISSEAKSVSSVVDNKFVPLVRMQANGKWVNIDGTGRLMPEI
jgi:hypothetical protein